MAYSLGSSWWVVRSVNTWNFRSRWCCQVCGPILRKGHRWDLLRRVDWFFTDNSMKGEAFSAGVLWGFVIYQCWNEKVQSFEAGEMIIAGRSDWGRFLDASVLCMLGWLLNVCWIHSLQFMASLWIDLSFPFDLVGLVLLAIFVLVGGVGT